MRRIVPLLWLVLVPWPAGTPARALAPVAVTTDTAVYCARLASRAAAREAGPEMRRLVQTGTAQCSRGEIRGGIMHLRRALLLIRAQEPAGSGPG